MPKSTFMNLNEEKRERIVRAAIGEFLNHGYEKANIGIIAKNAEIAKGSIYQYFENKKELFLYTVEWSVELLMVKYNTVKLDEIDHVNLFDLIYRNGKDVWEQVKEERELVIFVQEVFLGKYSSLADESMTYMLKVSDEYLLNYIREGKRYGYIREDIDDNILLLFMNGATIKLKTYMINKAKNMGSEIIDISFESVEKDMKDLIELLQHGMAKPREER